MNHKNSRTSAAVAVEDSYLLAGSSASSRCFI